MSKQYIKPNLIGGTKAPEGSAWRVFSLSHHHSIVLHTLSRYTKQPIGQIIAAALCLYESSHKDEIDEAFKKSKGNK